MLSPDMTIHHFSRANYQVQTTLLAQIPSMKRRCSRCTVTEQLPENSLQLKSSTRVRIQSGSPNCFRPKLSAHYLMAAIREIRANRLRGYKIAGPTVLARIPEKELSIVPTCRPMELG